MKGLLFVVALVSLVGAGAVAQDNQDDDGIGDLRTINLEAERKRLPPIQVGDVVRLVISSPSAGPDFSVGKVSVKIDGGSLQKVAAVRLGPQIVNGERVIGATRIGILLTAKSAGKATVKVTPISESGKELEPKTIELNVAKRTEAQDFDLLK